LMAFCKAAWSAASFDSLSCWAAHDADWICWSWLRGRTQEIQANTVFGITIGRSQPGSRPSEPT
jgi:hypothetical protein